MSRIIFTGLFFLFSALANASDVENKFVALMYQGLAIEDFFDLQVEKINKSTRDGTNQVSACLSSVETKSKSKEMLANELAGFITDNKHHLMEYNQFLEAGGASFFRKSLSTGMKLQIEKPSPDEEKSIIKKALESVTLAEQSLVDKNKLKPEFKPLFNLFSGQGYRMTAPPIQFALFFQCAFKDMDKISLKTEYTKEQKEQAHIEKLAKTKVAFNYMDKLVFLSLTEDSPKMSFSRKAFSPKNNEQKACLSKAIHKELVDFYTGGAQSYVQNNFDTVDDDIKYANSLIARRNFDYVRQKYFLGESVEENPMYISDDMKRGLLFGHSNTRYIELGAYLYRNLDFSSLAEKLLNKQKFMKTVKNDCGLVN